VADAARPYDAAVIGGGAAGCSAALALARLGARVVLLEARAYPHDKLCGEFLSPECARLLEAMGAHGALARLGAVPIETVTLTAPRGASWEARLPGIALGVSRRALDAELAGRAQAAGAEVRAGCAVAALAGSLEAGFELRLPHGRVRARAVIAAHGKRAALDRALGRRFLRRPQPFVALKAHGDGPSLPGRIELHGFPGGYFGMSDIEGGRTNFCLLAREPVFKAQSRAGRPVPAFLEWLRRQNPRLEARLARARPDGARWLSIAQVPFDGKGPVEGGVLMAGDAAGVIAPLAGDGIAMALRGGALAAEHAAAFLAGSASAAEAPRRYAAAWRAEFAPRLRLARALQAFMLRPGWLEPGLRLLRAVPALGRYLVTHTRDAALPDPKGLRRTEGSHDL
jgi:flavin-dependent dehydrogenase